MYGKEVSSFTVTLAFSLSYLNWHPQKNISILSLSNVSANMQTCARAHTHKHTHTHTHTCTHSHTFSELPSPVSLNLTFEALQLSLF
jgi:hypothetical protein